MSITAPLKLRPYSAIHTHTHPFNGPLSGTTRVSRYQKGKNQSGFYWSKRQWVAVASAGPCASLHLAPDRYHASTPPLIFYRPDALPAAQPAVSKHWRHSAIQICLLLLYTISNVTERIFCHIDCTWDCRDAVCDKFSLNNCLCTVGSLISDYEWYEWLWKHECKHQLRRQEHTSAIQVSCQVR